MDEIESHQPLRTISGRRHDVLLICDHASNRVPPELQDLGLNAEELQRHIAWDPGAAGVTGAMAAILGCQAILGGTSRLVVDLNRAEDDATLILAESDNTFVPANLPLDDAERTRRIARYHRPYHAHITATIDGLLVRGIQPTIIAIHSFNPVLGRAARPWPIGVLWKVAREPVAGLIDWFAQRGFNVGDNAPYDGRTHLGDTVDRHGIKRGLPHVMFELRNDQLLTEQMQQRWALDIAHALLESNFIARDAPL